MVPVPLQSLGFHCSVWYCQLDLILSLAPNKESRGQCSCQRSVCRAPALGPPADCSAVTNFEYTHLVHSKHNSVCKTSLVALAQNKDLWMRYRHIFSGTQGKQRGVNGASSATFIGVSQGQRSTSHVLTFKEHFVPAI
jgi:hypothetical protein